MPLLERVTTLLRANLNDLIDRAEDPEKMLKQLLLDMENQLLQVKTQVAVAIADQHSLERKKDDHAGRARDWTARAGLAVARGRDDLAREALDRSLTENSTVQALTEQLEDSRAQAEALRSTYLKLQRKLEETRARCEILRAAHRSARTLGRARAVTTPVSTTALDRYAVRIDAQAAQNHAHAVLAAAGFDEELKEMEREDQVNALLEQLKNHRALGT